MDWLERLGNEVTRQQGERRFWATLSLDGTATPHRRPDTASCPHTHLAREAEAYCTADAITDMGAGPSLLRRARQAAWQQEPGCLRALAARRGIMLPYGPLAMAEGEFRKLQELLWALLNQQAPEPQANVQTTAHFLIQAFLGRIVGLCGLEESGHILRLSARLLDADPSSARTVVEETILYCGRMAAWLDLAIPWYRLNDAVLQGQSARRESGGDA